MPFTRDSKGLRIFYEVHEPKVPNDRPPVVLVQGLGLSSKFWFDIPAQLARDPKTPYRTIVFDNPGTGRSDSPRGFLTTRAMADDIVSVLDALAIDRAIVVGMSLGGMVAQQAAIHHSRRVCGLVLLSTTPGLPHGRLASLPVLLTLLRTPFSKHGSTDKIARILLPEEAVVHADVLFNAWPPLLKAHPIGFRNFFRQLLAAATHSAGFQLSKIHCPTVIMTGDKDVLIPPINSKHLAKRIPHSVLEIVPDTGHALLTLDETAIQRALQLLLQR